MNRLKKFITLFLVIAISITCMVGTVSCKKNKNNTNCSHSWSSATCTKSATCSLCGETKGSALGHSGGQATCESQAICTVCNKPYGSVAGHNWVSGTCTDKKYCSSCYVEDSIDPDNHYGEIVWVKTANGHSQGYSCCGVTFGDEQPHNLISGVCEDCGFQPTINVANVTASIGQTVNVEISIEDNPGITCLEITVYFDASKLTLNSATNGATLGGLTFTSTSNLGNGAKCIWDGTDCSSNNGIVVVLNFTVLDTTPEGEYTVSVTAKGYDDDVAQVTFVVNDGTITVE